MPRLGKNVYPAWMDVKSCGGSSYDLPPGKSEKTGSVTVKYEGVLLGVGGHMHDYGRQIVLQDASRKETWRTLGAKSDAQGHLESVPVKLFVQEGGYKFAKGDVLKVSATYDNPTGKLLREGAMGIAVGYFAASDDARWRRCVGIQSVSRHGRHVARSLRSNEVRMPLKTC